MRACAGDILLLLFSLLFLLLFSFVSLIEVSPQTRGHRVSRTLPSLLPLRFIDFFIERKVHQPSVCAYVIRGYLLFSCNGFR